MINLAVHEFCHNCPDFKAETYMCLNFKRGVTFKVQCERHEFCKKISEMIAEKYGKKGEDSNGC